MKQRHELFGVRNRYFSMAFALITSLCLVVTLLLPAAAQARNIKVGVIDCYSGPAAVFGKDALNGFQLALEEINARGVLGGKIDFTTRDTKFKVDIALNMAKELVMRENVDVLVGTINSGAAMAVSEAVNLAMAQYFRQQGVEGLVICPLDFGDERSACKIAERLRVPTLLYATKEPPARDDPGLNRVSDSYCGNLSISSGLHRRKIPFRFAGLFFPDEPGLARELEAFARAVSVSVGGPGQSGEYP